MFIITDTTKCSVEHPDLAINENIFQIVESFIVFDINVSKTGLEKPEIQRMIIQFNKVYYVILL